MKDNNTNKGKYFFTIGGFEKGGFRNSKLKDSKYIGRFKTKDKYLGLLFLFDLRIYHKKTFKYEIDFAFFDKYSDYIIGDVFLIEDESIENKLDDLMDINDSTTKENIITINLDINEELKCFTYFFNFDELEEILKLSKDIVNEYSIDEKIKRMETIIKLDSLKGKDNSMSNFFIQLQKLKESGQDMSKLLE